MYQVSRTICSGPAPASSPPVCPASMIQRPGTSTTTPCEKPRGFDQSAGCRTFISCPPNEMPAEASAPAGNSDQVISRRDRVQLLAGMFGHREPHADGHRKHHERDQQERLV